jgi:hypothetical protein
MGIIIPNFSAPPSTPVEEQELWFLKNVHALPGLPVCSQSPSPIHHIHPSPKQQTAQNQVLKNNPLVISAEQQERISDQSNRKIARSQCRYFHLVLDSTI